MPWANLEVKEQTVPSIKPQPWLHMLALIIGALCIACSTNDSPMDQGRDITPDQTCTGYFGQPNDQSGLDSSQCNTTCMCASSALVLGQIPLDSSTFAFTHQNPMEPLSEDPYESSVPSQPSEKVCTVDIDAANGSYRLSTVPMLDAASDRITHAGPCGACSSLQDLYVYAANVDLTDPVRQCGIIGIGQGMAANIECLQDIGFSEACATIWYYNTQHTRTQCLNECLTHLNSPYVDMNGQLNPCLECDEVKSGPVFKAYAGRTRRNSGLASAICRPCTTVSRVTHEYLTP
jgi:hypothetical protein